jgi:hypothetical protein
MEAEVTTPGQAPVASVAEAAERSQFALRRAVVDVAMRLLHAERFAAWLASAAPGDELPGAGGDLQRYLPRPEQRRGWTSLKAIS